MEQAGVGWMELVMLTGLVAVLVGLVALLVLAGRAQAQSQNAEIVISASTGPTTGPSPIDTATAEAA